MAPFHIQSTQRDNLHNEDDAENEDEVQEYWANNCEYFDPYMPMEVIIPPCPFSFTVVLAPLYDRVSFETLQTSPQAKSLLHLLFISKIILNC